MILVEESKLSKTLVVICDSTVVPFVSFSIFSPIEGNQRVLRIPLPQGVQNKTIISYNNKVQSFAIFTIWKGYYLWILTFPGPCLGPKNTASVLASVHVHAKFCINSKSLKSYPKTLFRGHTNGQTIRILSSVSALN